VPVSKTGLSKLDWGAEIIPPSIAGGMYEERSASAIAASTKKKCGVLAVVDPEKVTV
jgi:hypothetical protein